MKRVLINLLVNRIEKQRDVFVGFSFNEKITVVN